MIYSVFVVGLVYLVLGGGGGGGALLLLWRNEDLLKAAAIEISYGLQCKEEFVVLTMTLLCNVQCLMATPQLHSVSIVLLFMMKAVRTSNAACT